MCVVSVFCVLGTPDPQVMTAGCAIRSRRSYSEQLECLDRFSVNIRTL